MPKTPEDWTSIAALVTDKVKRGPKVKGQALEQAKRHTVTLPNSTTQRLIRFSPNGHLSGGIRRAEVIATWAVESGAIKGMPADLLQGSDD